MFKTEPGFFFENTATFSSPLQLLTQKLESPSTSLSSMIHYIPFISNQIQFSTPEMFLESIHCPPPHATPHDPPGLHCPHPSSRRLTSPTALLHLTPKIPLKRCISRTMRNFLMASFYTQNIQKSLTWTTRPCVICPFLTSPTPSSGYPPFSIL